jgi:hypothetical protein
MNQTKRQRRAAGAEARARKALADLWNIPSPTCQQRARALYLQRRFMARRGRA